MRLKQRDATINALAGRPAVLERQANTPNPDELHSLARK